MKREESSALRIPGAVARSIAGAARGSTVIAGTFVALANSFMDLFTDRTDRKLHWISSWDPLLAAECAHRLSSHSRLDDLLLQDVMGVTLMISRLERLFDEIWIENGDIARFSGR